MTTKGEWKKYTGSDKQIAEIQNAKEFIYRYKTQSGKFVESFIEDMLWKAQINNLSHYWIIPDDPLREMKIRQAQTGQPVWIKKNHDLTRMYRLIGPTTNPDWNIPNAEYSFTNFEE